MQTNYDYTIEQLEKLKAQTTMLECESELKELATMCQNNVNYVTALMILHHYISFTSTQQTKLEVFSKFIAMTLVVK